MQWSGMSVMRQLLRQGQEDQMKTMTMATALVLTMGHVPLAAQDVPCAIFRVEYDQRDRSSTFPTS
jgi:hypothetical protein